MTEFSSFNPLMRFALDSFLESSHALKLTRLFRCHQPLTRFHMPIKMFDQFCRGLVFDVPHRREQGARTRIEKYPCQTQLRAWQNAGEKGICTVLDPGTLFTGDRAENFRGGITSQGKDKRS
jgi:hypothetical protein